MINLYYFTDRVLQAGFTFTLDSDHFNHANSKLIIKPKYIELGSETRYPNKILKEMATVYAKLLNQYIFKYRTVLSARFAKQDEDGQMIDEIELFIKMEY